MLDKLELQSLDNVASKIQSDLELRSVVKLFGNCLSRLGFLKPADMKSNDKTKESEILEQLCEEILARGLEVSNDSNKVYSTTEIGQIFGVSKTTVNNWIDNKRLTGVVKVSGKHTKIPDTAIWISTTGGKFTVKEMTEEFKFEKYSNLTRKDILIGLVKELMYFEEKYGNNIESLEAKENKTDEEYSDLVDWKYYLERLENVK